jgi:uncharacterized protein (UPF0333 family)
MHDQKVYGRFLPLFLSFFFLNVFAAPLWAFSNGSFELPQIPSGRWDKNSDDIPTWESNVAIEFYKSGVYNTKAVDGNQFIDLASPDSELNFVQQTLTTTVNQALDIEFYGKAGIIRVSANEEIIGVYESSDQKWQKHQIRYVADSTETRLRFFAYTFDALGTKTGNFLDAVTVNAVLVPDVVDNAENSEVAEIIDTVNNADPVDTSNDNKAPDDNNNNIIEDNTPATDANNNDSNDLGDSGNSLDEASGGAADFTAPTLTSIIRQSPLVEKTNVSNVVMRVSFSEDVFNIDEADFQVQQTGSLNGRIVRVTQVDQKTYDVSIDNLDGSGSLTVGINQTHDIVDLAGNPLLL